MVDVISLLTGGSDNLYKYLFIGGLGMIILSLFYPVNKKYEYSCQIDTYNNEVNLLNNEIELLEEKTTAFEKQSSKIVEDLENLKKSAMPDERKRLALKDSHEKQYATIINGRDAIERKKIAIEYNKARINTLEVHIKDFTKYENIFFWVGILFSIFGIIGWYNRMQKDRPKPS